MFQKLILERQFQNTNATAKQIYSVTYLELVQNRIPMNEYIEQIYKDCFHLEIANQNENSVPREIYSFCYTM